MVKAYVAHEKEDHVSGPIAECNPSSEYDVEARADISLSGAEATLTNSTLPNGFEVATPPNLSSSDVSIVSDGDDKEIYLNCTVTENTVPSNAQGTCNPPTPLSSVGLPESEVIGSEDTEKYKSKSFVDHDDSYRINKADNVIQNHEKYEVVAQIHILLKFNSTFINPTTLKRIYDVSGIKYPLNISLHDVGIVELLQPLVVGTGAYSGMHDGSFIIASFRNQWCSIPHADRHVQARFFPHEDNIMQCDRLTSFARWPVARRNISPAALARNGFFYLGDLDRVKCFSCGGVLRNWTVEDGADGEERTHFPRCAMMRNAGERKFPIPEDAETTEERASQYPANPLIKNEANSLETLGHRWPASRVHVTLAQIVEAGFSFFGERDRVKCLNCDGRHQNWEPDDGPCDEHAKFLNILFRLREKGQKLVCGPVAMNAPLVRPITAKQDWLPLKSGGHQDGIGALDIPQDGHRIRQSHPPHSVTGIKREMVDIKGSAEGTYTLHREEGAEQQLNAPPPSTRRNDFGHVARRIETFNSFPIRNQQVRRTLAEWGFHYLGDGTRVICFHCKNAVNEWRVDNDPKERMWHKLDCGFLLGNNGDHERRTAESRVSQLRSISATVQQREVRSEGNAPSSALLRSENRRETRRILRLNRMVPYRARNRQRNLQQFLLSRHGRCINCGHDANVLCPENLEQRRFNIPEIRRCIECEMEIQCHETEECVRCRGFICSRQACQQHRCELMTHLAQPNVGEPRHDIPDMRQCIECQVEIRCRVVEICMDCRGFICSLEECQLHQCENNERRLRVFDDD